MLIFIDDSGDPGFKVAKGSTNVFVIGLIIFRERIEDIWDFGFGS